MLRNILGRHLRQVAEVALVLLLVGGLPPQSPAAEASRVFTKGPYLQAPGQTSMTIMWESTADGEGTVRYGLDGKMSQTITGGSPKVISASGAQFYLYAATVEGLKPGTTYTYSVEQQGTRSSPKRFRTFGEHPDKVVFITYGDTRSNPEIHADLAKWFKQFNPDFILHTGDLVTRGKQYDLWEKEFFGPLANVIDEIPLLSAIGNHEDDGTNYLAQFHLPDQELWYSFDAGAAHFLALDSRYPSQAEPQYEFAQKDLPGSHAPWKIVFLHIPIFNFGGHNSMWGHEAYLPLLHKARVDLVVSGHSHLYERFKPLTSEADKGQWAITHITTGGGGAPLAKAIENPSHAAYSRTNHFVVFEVTKDTLKGQAISREGKTIDEFTLKKTDDQYSSEYLAGAYSETQVINDIKKAGSETSKSAPKKAAKSK